MAGRRRIIIGFVAGAGLLCLAALVIVVVRLSESGDAGPSDSGRVEDSREQGVDDGPLAAPDNVREQVIDSGPAAMLDNSHLERAIQRIMASIEDSPHYMMDIQQVFDSLGEAHGPSKRVISLALLVRKKESLPLLTRILESGTSAEKRSALLLVQKVCRWKETVPQIRTILRDQSQDELLRLRAAAAAAILGNKECVGAITDLYRSSRTLEAREASVAALGYLGSDGAREALEEALREGHARIRANAACALAKLGYPPPLEAVRPMLGDPAWPVRRLGVETLGYLGTEGRGLLEKIALRETSPSVASEIKVSICRLETRGLRNDDLYSYLESSLNSPDRQVKLWAAERLFEGFGRRAGPVLARRYLDGKGTWRGALEMYLLWLYADR